MSTTLKTLRLYFEEYPKHPWRGASVSLLGVGAVLQNIISPLFIAKLVGELASHSTISPSYIWAAALSLVIGNLFAFIGDRFGSMPLTVATTYNLHAKCLNVLLRQDYNFFADSFAGSLVTQANRLVKGYELFVNVIYLDMFGVWFGVFTAVGIMCYYNAAIGIGVGILWVLSIITVMLLVRRRIPVRRHAVAQESKLTGELADDITNNVTIKTFASETIESRRYEINNYELSKRYERSWKRAISNHFLIQVLCIALQLLVLVAGIAAVRHGTLTIATFLLFEVYILRIIDSVSKASLQMRQLEGIFGDAAEMTELFDRVPAVLDPLEPAAPAIRDGLIAFDKVRFSYHPDDQQAALFQGLSLQIRPGERVGLVGPSGGGKTSLTKLLLRFMNTQAGTISIDGQNIHDIRQSDLHRVIAYVPQEPLLFHRSLLENISYGQPDATKAEIVEAAKQAHAHEFIVELPNGYDTLVGERGIKLSGGQRQRIAVARAMLKDAPILVLDEATSALDSESEKYIQEALWKLMKGKTTLVIAHRLSTIQRLDRIIVLDNGRVLESGSHTELLKQKGLYAKLWAHQSGGFLEE